WRRLEKEGRLLTGFSGNNTDGSLNFTPKMDSGHLVEGYHRILRTLYRPSEYYSRVLNNLKRIGPGVPEKIGGTWFQRLAAHAPTDGDGSPSSGLTPVLRTEAS